MWQYVVLAIVILSAIGYVAYRTWQTFRAASDPCHGCAGCAIHDQLKQSKKGKGARSCVLQVVSEELFVISFVYTISYKIGYRDLLSLFITLS